MKVLQICNKSPFPTIEGGPIAMHAVTDMLIKNHCEVKILAFNSDKFFLPIHAIPEDYKKATSIELVYVDLKVKTLQAIKCLFTNKSYHIERFVSEAFAEKLKDILTLNQYDVVWMESLYVTPYIPTIRMYSKAKIVLRAHNIEHKIWERVSRQTKHIVKKLYLKILSLQLKRYELKVANQVDAIATISSVDQAYYKLKDVRVPLITIPFGIDVKRISGLPVSPKVENLFSLASMNWIPNLEGIQWFLNSVWMKIHTIFPDMQLLIAGRHMPDSLRNVSYPQVEKIGEVPDAIEFMRSNGILIVPLFSGSGIRIKIIEAMSLGKIVITTSVGLEGVDAAHKQHVLIANTSEEFVEAVKFCVANPDKMKEIGFNAAEYIRFHHNDLLVAEKMITFLKRLINS